MIKQALNTAHMFTKVQNSVQIIYLQSFTITGRREIIASQPKYVAYLTHT